MAAPKKAPQPPRTPKRLSKVKAELLSPGSQQVKQEATPPISRQAPATPPQGPPPAAQLDMSLELKEEEKEILKHAKFFNRKKEAKVKRLTMFSSGQKNRARQRGGQVSTPAKKQLPEQFGFGLVKAGVTKLSEPSRHKALKKERTPWRPPGHSKLT